MSGLPKAVPVGRRWVAFCAIALVCPILTAALPANATAERSGFAGTIKDSVGQVLDGVEILIVRRSSTAEAGAVAAPIANAASDAWGRFAIPDLSPGVYSIAALKKGYRAHIDDIDTRIQRVIEVVLFPMPVRSSLAPGNVPEDDAWRLRLPRRTVFRETEAGSEPADEEDVAALPSLDVPIQMRVDQLFAVGAPFPGQNGEAVKLQGNETRVRLATPLGERGSLRVDGRRERLGSTLQTAEGGSASSESAGMSVDFSYDTSLDSRFAVKAFYNERDLEWGAAAALPLGSRRQSWGYQSEWQKQLGDQSSVRVGVDFNDDTVRLPLSDGAVGEFAGPGTDRELARRAVAADGSFEGLAGDRHQFEVAFKARLFDSPGPLLTFDERAEGFATRDAAGGGDPIAAADGWSLELSAQDSWAMSGPFTLLYGLDYQRARTDRPTAVVVPSMGGAWAVDRVALRFTVSYHAVAESDPSTANSKYDPLGSSPYLKAGDRPSRGAWLPPRDVGFEAEVELPITGTLRLKGASSFEPIRLEGLGGPLFGRDGAGGRDSFLTDGTAAVGETSLSLVHDVGDARTWFEISRGQAHGMLALGSDQHTALPTLAMGELNYDNGSWGFQLIPSGTDLRVHYKRVVESQTGDRGARPISERETVELRLIQSLMRFQALGNWRLLMAVRMAMQNPEDDEAWAQAADPAVLRAFNEGVSAGLSVTF